MKINIVIAKSGCSSEAAMAMLEANDGGDQIEICLRKYPRTACKEAAKKLRDLADKFERLSDEETPFNGEIQKKVNRVRRL